MVSWRHGEHEEYDARLRFASERDQKWVVRLPIDDIHIIYTASKREHVKRSKVPKPTRQPRGQTPKT